MCYAADNNCSRGCIGYPYNRTQHQYKNDIFFHGDTLPFINYSNWFAEVFTL